MAVKSPAPTVDDYLARQPDAVRPLLKRLRSAILKAVPGADESISYQMPTYKLDGQRIIYFAAWKEHVALYPATKAVVDALPKALAPRLTHKGTIRFPYSEPLPLVLVARIVRLRVREEFTVVRKAPVRKKSATHSRRSSPEN